MHGRSRGRLAGFPAPGPCPPDSRRLLNMTTAAPHLESHALRPWLAADLRDDMSWRHRLSASATAGLEKALTHARVANKSWFEMTPHDFPMGEEARAEIGAAFASTQRGFGLCLLQGFPVQRWSADDCRLALWGIGLHVGVARPQNKMSEVMNDVRDVGASYKVKGGRGYNTNAGLDFHVDSGDVVALLCLHQAPIGGDSLVANSIALRDEVRRRRPDLLRVLQQPIYFSNQGAGDPAKAPIYQCPIFSGDGEPFACRMNRKNVEAAYRDFPDRVPPMSSEQVEALDLLDELMADDRFTYSMKLSQGDLQILNNYVNVHSRTSFEDHDDPARKRHLLRLWLSLPQSQPLPRGSLEFYGDIRPGSVRGGNRGSHITPEFLSYEARQAHALGMTLG